MMTLGFTHAHADDLTGERSAEKWQKIVYGPLVGLVRVRLFVALDDKNGRVGKGTCAWELGESQTR